ncbi:MAG: MFS transporter [Bacteroidota bacterium]|nr:MFS transporter [Bacteroidota bacterium]
MLINVRLGILLLLTFGASTFMTKNNPRTIRAWTMYDWANSVYSLAITTAVFPIYFASATREASGSDHIPFLGIGISSSVLYSYAISFSFFLLLFISPILSGVADFSGRKKTFMQFFATLGSFSCAMLFFFTGDNVEWGVTFSILASIGYAGSLVFYNAYLPEIATHDRLDKISAKGFSMGYAGSVIHLVLALILIMNYSAFGLPGEGLASRISFLSVGIWWFAFAQYSFYYLPVSPERKPLQNRILSKGFRELRGVWQQLRSLPKVKTFLTAFFLYNMGVQTVMLLAATFGDQELKLETAFLIQTVLAIQLVAIAGAYLFSRISHKKGNVYSLSAMLAIWIFICAGAFVVENKWSFMGLAIIVGLVMGGIQSLSRASYAKLLPDTENTASFFSFYDVLEKAGTMIGTGIFATVLALWENMRLSLIPLTLFFILGMLVLQRLRGTPELQTSFQAS